MSFSGSVDLVQRDNVAFSFFFARRPIWTSQTGRGGRGGIRSYLLHDTVECCNSNRSRVKRYVIDAYLMFICYAPACTVHAIKHFVNHSRLTAV